MAVSTVSSFLLPSFGIPSSSPSSTRLKVSLLPSSSTHGGLSSCVLTKPSVSLTKVFAVPDTLDPTPEILDEPASEVHSFLCQSRIRLFAELMRNLGGERHCFAESFSTLMLILLIIVFVSV